MLLTISNLPENTRYQDVKSLIQAKCGITDIILDNLVNVGASKKVTVGLAEEEDAAILMRKINGLYINGKELHVEDVRKNKKQAQPTAAPNSFNMQHQAYYMYPNMQYPSNPQPSVSNPQTYQFCEAQMDMYQQSYQAAGGMVCSNRDPEPEMQEYRPETAASSSTLGSSSYMNVQNTYTPYGQIQVQAHVQYPMRKDMPQPSASLDEPLGFRSKRNDEHWSKPGVNQDFPPKSGDWPSQSNRENWRSKYEDRSEDRRESPQRDSRFDSRRESHDSWHDRDRGRYSPQRSFKPFESKIKDGYDRRESDGRFQLKKDPKNRCSDTNSQQFRTKTGSGSSKSNNWRDEIQQRQYRSGDNFEPPHKKIKPAPNQEKTNTIGLLKLTQRFETLCGQSASQIAKEMLAVRPKKPIFDMLFFKELKRAIRERIMGLNISAYSSIEDMNNQYRKCYKKATDNAFIQHVLKLRAALPDPIIPKAEPAPAPLKPPCEIKVEQKEKPVLPTAQPKEPQVKIIPQKPLVPRSSILSNNPKIKTTKGVSIYKDHRDFVKQTYADDTLLTGQLNEVTFKVLEEELDGLYEQFMSECKGAQDKDEELFIERLSTTVADDFRKILKVNVSNRLLSSIRPALRVYTSAILSIGKLTYELQKQGIVGLKRSKKSGMILAICKSFEVFDKLCTGPDINIDGVTVSFEPLQISGPPIKVTKEDILRQRKEYKDRVVASYENMVFNTEKDDGANSKPDEVKIKSEGDEKISIKSEIDPTKLNITLDSDDIDAQIECLASNIHMEDFVDSEDEINTKDMIIDEFGIVEDTIGNFDNKDCLSKDIDFTLDKFTDGTCDDKPIKVGNEDGENKKDINKIDKNSNDEDDKQNNIDDNEHNGDYSGVKDVTRGNEAVNDGDNDIDDVEIGDIDENDLEDY